MIALRGEVVREPYFGHWPVEEVLRNDPVGAIRCAYCAPESCLN